MTMHYKLGEEITKQLDEQGVFYEFLSAEDLEIVELKWKEKYIGKRTAPNIEYYKWHIFSFHSDINIEGEKHPLNMEGNILAIFTYLTKDFNMD